MNLETVKESMFSHGFSHEEINVAEPIIRHQMRQTGRFYCMNDNGEPLEILATCMGILPGSLAHSGIELTGGTVHIAPKYRRYRGPVPAQRTILPAPEPEPVPAPAPATESNVFLRLYRLMLEFLRRFY